MVEAAVVAVLEDEEVDQPGRVVQPRVRAVGRPPPDPAVRAHQVVAGEGGELLQGGVHLGRPGDLDQAAGPGLGQQHRHGGPFAAVGPVRPPLVGHGQAGQGVAGHEPPGPGPLERAVTVEQDGHPSPHQLGQRPVEQHPDPDGVAVVRADVELDHPVGPARDRRAVPGPLHGQALAGPPGVGPGERRPARAGADPHGRRVLDPERGPDHGGQLGDAHGGLGHGQEGRLVLEPGQLPDEPVGRPGASVRAGWPPKACGWRAWSVTWSSRWPRTFEPVNWLRASTE